MMLITNNLYKDFYPYSQELQSESFLGIKNIQTSATQTNKEEKTTNKKFFNIGMSTMVGLLVLLMSSKGLQKIIGNKINKLSDFLEYQIEENSLYKQSKIKKFNNHIFKNINDFLYKTKSINNITSLKDILFKKIMFLSKPTQKIHVGISDWFEKLSIKTLDKNYKKTKKVFNKMYDKFDKLDEFILKKYGNDTIKYYKEESFNKEEIDYTVSELIEKARIHREYVKDSIDAFFSDNTIKTRYEYIKKHNSKLCSTFWDASFKDFGTRNNKFKRKEMWQTFIAEEQMKNEKTQLAKNVAILRNMISYNNKDKGIAIYKYLNELKNMLPSFDKTGYAQVKKLEWFAKHSESLEKSKESFIKELNKLGESQNYNNVDPQIIKKLEECKKDYINLISGVVQENDIGDIQNMINIYYKIAPFELEKSGALSLVKKSVKTFDKTVDLEISEFFDKVRDLELGSAPTDILTIVLSSILITWELLKAKNKNEKTSVVLTSGIPLAGAIATTMISTTKLISGGKSLALGAISGLVLNIIGKKAASMDFFKHNKNTNTEQKTLPRETLK